MLKWLEGQRERSFRCSSSSSSGCCCFLLLLQHGFILWVPSHDRVAECVHGVAAQLDVVVPLVEGRGARLKHKSAADLVKLPVEAPFADHHRSHLFRPLRRDVQQRAQLGEGNVVVQNRRRPQVVLDQRLLQNGPVRRRRLVVPLQVRPQLRHVLRAQDPVQVHLHQHAVHRAQHRRRPVVLHKHPEQPRALRAGAGERRAHRRVAERLPHLVGAGHHERELVVLAPRLEELALPVVHACEARVEEQLQALLGARPHQRPRLVRPLVGCVEVTQLEVQACNLHEELDAVPRAPLYDAGVVE
eukprot:Rhum_TRINITY_DN15752_c0_g1::Rhum_TRINITY_DN15752_c0_g1_i1::g.162016::m.162016